MKIFKSPLKLILGLVIPWIVFADLAVSAPCDPNLSPSAPCGGLLLDESNLTISISSSVIVNSFPTPEWAVDIDDGTENITLTNSGVIDGVDRGISLKSTATNISITNATSGLIVTSSGPAIFNEGGISTLTNNGFIESPYSGITNQGEINALTNNFVIFGQLNTIDNGGGRITYINNNDSLISGQFSVSNTAGAYIGSILNTNSIEVDTAAGLGIPFSSGVLNFQSEIGSITNITGSTILSTDNTGSSLVNSGISNTNAVEGPIGNSSIGDIDNRGSIRAIGGQIAAGILNGYLPKLSGDPPTTASGRNTIQSIANYGTLYAEGEGFIAAGVLNGGFAPLTVSGDRDESYNHIARIENFSLIEGKTTTPTGFFGAGIFNGAINFSGGISNRDGYVIDELINNSGSTIVGSSANTLGVGILNSGVIREIRNAGSIESTSSGGSALGIYNIGVIETLNNQATGTIQDGIFNVAIGMGADPANISNLINAGVIQNAGSNFDPDAIPGIGTTASFAIQNYGGATINNLTNAESGRIINGIGNSTDSTINYLTNLGEIQAGMGGYGIVNAGTIGELNNAQGGTQPLTYSGPLPTNYNVIIYGPSSYGKLEVTSPGFSQTRFGIYGGSLLSNGTYGSVLKGVTRGNLYAVTGTYGSATWSLINSSGTIWDLLISGIVTGPPTADTQQSLANTASVLQGTFTLQNTVMVNGFTYDCSLFDKHGICVSAGGRNTTVQAQGINNTSGLLIASYRLNKNNSRIGAWVDQNLSVSGPGTVQLGNSTPMIGLFGVWSQRPDGTGTEVKVSAAYGQKDTTITRQILGTSEAGSGGSQLNSQGAQLTAKYGFGVVENVIVSPYIGMRYTQNNMNGYTEGASSSVTAPLTYSALNTNATTALAGVGASYRFIPQATVFASAGIETDTNTNNGTYSATGINGLTPVNFNPNSVKTRPTATVGAYYDIEKNQRLGITGIYRQEPYQAVSTTTVLATYTIGL